MASLRAGKTKAVVKAPPVGQIDKTIVKRDRGDDLDWYLVKNGETLLSIAKKHKVSLAQIKKWNRLKSNAIHAGLRLKISEA
jgi:membrane-bound lytic murein transglycosylase D